MGFINDMKTIKPAFWLANGQEACERLAYFGIRAILPLMMVSVGSGGLGLDMTQKGIIYSVWAFIQCIVPMVSGGFTESFGYKKSLIVAFLINTCGYLLMGHIPQLAALMTGTTETNTTINFILMFVAGCTIGLGTAIFKPPVQGIVARSLNKTNSGFGFGLFYWVVNIGGFLAPMAASALRGSDTAPTWQYVFYGATFVTLFNLIITLLFFKEPERAFGNDKADVEKTAADALDGASDDASDDKQKASETAAPAPRKSSRIVLIETLQILWHDKLILAFLLIVSGFWLMFMQLWDLLPNFLDEWVDRRSVGGLLANYPIFDVFLESDKALKPEMIINIDSAIIILFVLPLSALFAKFKMMTALVLGMVISVIGFILSGLTMSGEIACLAVLIFAIGEIICSPKFNEYIGMTAPNDKKAIYMGFSNMPFAIGWGVGNLLSGPLYEALSSKAALARKFLVANGADSTQVKDMNIHELMPQVQQMLSQQTQTEVDAYQATEALWNMYSPWVIWLILGGIGFISMIGMIIFYFKSDMSKKDKMQEQEEQQETKTQPVPEAFEDDDTASKL